MSERFKLPLWIWPLIFAALVALLGWWGNDRVRQTLEGQLRAQLETTLDANVTALTIWATNQTRMATVLADEPQVKKVADQILESGFSPIREPEPRSDLEQFIHDLHPLLSQLGYPAAQLVSTNYHVLANSLRPQFGGRLEISEAHTNKFAALFESGQPVIITPFKPDLLLQRRAERHGNPQWRTNEFRRLGRPGEDSAMRRRRGDVSLMQVAAPIHNAAGQVVGALALIINPDKEFSRILSVARSGASGETYAFDQTGLMISHSRFDNQLRQLGLLEGTNTSSALNLRLSDPGGDLTEGFKSTNADSTPLSLTRLVAGALDDQEAVNVMPTRDYRGVPVVGASRWLPQFGFGVATQMDASEAYRPLHVLQWVFEILFLVLLLCAIGMFVFSYTNMVSRRRLSAAEFKLKQLGQYALEEKIGEGGMGVVYRARHALLRRETAVKLLLPDRAEPEAVARFENEVCLTCQLTHPNTIQVYDYGHTPDGIFYYAMEYLHGLNLHDMVARFGSLPEGRVIHILTQICDSLAEAHQLGLIHRDIKPANIFLCERGGLPDWVKVLDFGLVKDCRAETAAQTPSAGRPMIEGTPWFTPPEAIHGNTPVDACSDIYSLGVLGYYLLTGQYLFDADTIEEVHEKQLSAVPIPPSERMAGPISSEMEQLLLDCLEKEPSRRPQSVSVVRDRLAACPAAGTWTDEMCRAWWGEHRLKLTASLDADPLNDNSPMPTMKIDLAGRVKSPANS